jgi:Luciferase-like monooxygenase
MFMQQQLDLLAAADPLGFDSVWINEHHFDSWGGLMSAPTLVLAGLSQRSQYVRLGTSIAKAVAAAGITIGCAPRARHSSTRTMGRLMVPRLAQI